MEELRDNTEHKKKTFRSLIKKYFPIDLLLKLEEVSIQCDIDNNSKTPEITKLLKEYGVPYEPLGNGTNRYGILIDGYAFKIALDRAGKVDNRREFKYSKAMYPAAIKVYESLTSGLIASSEYVSIFTLDDYYKYQEDMRAILREISKNFLVGDIGVSPNNYVNWGIRNDGTICILDFAYIYSLSYKGFTCTCEDEGILQFDNDFVYLKCPMCGKKYQFGDIRRRISRADEEDEIGNIGDIGYILHDEVEELEEVPEFSPHDFMVKKKKSKHKQRNDCEKKEDEITSESQADALSELNKLISEFNIKTIRTKR